MSAIVRTESVSVRFNSAPGAARWITLSARKVSGATAYALILELLTDAGSKAYQAALDRFVSEAFPARSLKVRLVNPRSCIASLSEDLQIQLARMLCTTPEAFYGV